ncbi:MAG: hypothetical protein WBB67_01570 [bacterium]
MKKGVKMDNNRNHPGDKDNDAFLIADFNQCFEQTRHYNTQIVNTLKFITTFYTAVCGLVWGLFQYSIKKNIDIKSALIIALCVVLLFGIIILIFAVRNRVYFVKCMRYVNEQRGYFLSRISPKFANKSGMPVDPAKLKYFNWSSSQSWLVYIISLMNSLILGLFLFILVNRVDVALLSGICLFIIQLLLSICYLCSQDHGKI